MKRSAFALPPPSVRRLRRARIKRLHRRAASAYPDAKRRAARNRHRRVARAARCGARQPGGSVDRGLFRSIRAPAGTGARRHRCRDLQRRMHRQPCGVAAPGARKIRRFGDTWTAIGAFHSTRPDKRDAYAGKVREVFEAISRLSSGCADAARRRGIQLRLGWRELQSERPVVPSGQGRQPAARRRAGWRGRGSPGPVAMRSPKTSGADETRRSSPVPDRWSRWPRTPPTITSTPAAARREGSVAGERPNAWRLPQTRRHAADAGAGVLHDGRSVERER